MLDLAHKKNNFWTTVLINYFSIRLTILTAFPIRILYIFYMPAWICPLDTTNARKYLIIKRSFTLGKMKLFIGIHALVQQKQNHHPKVYQEEQCSIVTTATRNWIFPSNIVLGLCFIQIKFLTLHSSVFWEHVIVYEKFCSC